MARKFEPPMDFGDYLSHLMDDRGITAVELARLLSDAGSDGTTVSESLVRKVRNGEREPSNYLIRPISRVLDLSEEECRQFQIAFCYRKRWKWYQKDYGLSEDRAKVIAYQDSVRLITHGNTNQHLSSREPIAAALGLTEIPKLGGRLADSIQDLNWSKGPGSKVQELFQRQQSGMRQLFAPREGEEGDSSRSRPEEADIPLYLFRYSRILDVLGRHSALLTFHGHAYASWLGAEDVFQDDSVVTSTRVLRSALQVPRRNLASLPNATLLEPPTKIETPYDFLTTYGVPVDEGVPDAIAAIGGNTCQPASAWYHKSPTIQMPGGRV